MKTAAAAFLLAIPVVLAGGMLEADTQFRRGDANADGILDLADPVALLWFIFLGGSEVCHDAGDFNDSGDIDISDPLHGLTYLFLEGPEPPPPFAECGSDPTADGLDCFAFAPCEGAVLNEIRSIKRSNAGIEIEVYSTNAFPVRALQAVLCVGQRGFFPGLGLPGGDLHTLIFTLTPEEFAETHDGDLVTVQHGGCSPDISQLRPYWDLWIFGPLDKGLLEP